MPHMWWDRTTTVRPAVSAGWTGGSTRRWRKRRAEVLERDRNQCRLKVPGICTGTATCVHHTLGRAVTGDEDMRYLVASCTECNQHIGDPATHTDCPLCAQPAPRTKW